MPSCHFGRLNLSVLLLLVATFLFLSLQNVHANSPECFAINDGILTIPKDQTEIADNTYYNCTRLRQVMFESPSTLKRIGVNAFRETSLGNYVTLASTDSVEIPKSVETIGDSAFRQCAKLTHVRFGFEEGIFSGSSLTHIAPSVFAFTNLYHFIVPPSVQNISDSAFEGNIEFAELTFASSRLHPASIKHIGVAAFRGCVKLGSVISEKGGGSNAVFPKSLETIAERAFENAALHCLLNVTYTAGRCPTPAGAISFDDSESPRSSLRFIGKWAFKGAGLMRIELPPSVKNIRKGAFEDTSRLKSVEFMGTYSGAASTPAQIQLIPDSCFRQSAVESIYLPPSVKVIGPNAFRKCEQLKTVGIDYTLPNGLLDIQYGAFRESGLEIIQLPRNLTSIGEYAFHNSTRLTDVDFFWSGNNADCPYYGANQVLRIANRAFDGCPLLELKMPGSVVYTGAKRKDRYCPTDSPTPRPTFVPTAPPSFTPVLKTGSTPFAAVVGVGAFLGFGVLMSIVTWWQQLRVY